MKYVGMIILACLMSLSAWSQSSEQVRDAEAIRVLIESVKILAEADLSCESADDCLAIEVGARPCGGPSDFYTTSRHNQNLEEVEYLSRQSSLKASAYNRKYRLISTCNVRMPLPPRCLRNVCQ